MWVFCEDGTFYSAVVNCEDSTKRVVRTRDERSAYRLAEWLTQEGHAGEYECTPDADYAYRIWCDSVGWEGFLSSRAQEAQATNFKSEVERNLGRGDMTEALHDIWLTMWKYQHKQD